MESMRFPIPKPFQKDFKKANKIIEQIKQKLIEAELWDEHCRIGIFGGAASNAAIYQMHGEYYPSSDIDIFCFIKRRYTEGPNDDDWHCDYEFDVKYIVSNLLKEQYEAEAYEEGSRYSYNFASYQFQLEEGFSVDFILSTDRQHEKSFDYTFRMCAVLDNEVVVDPYAYEDLKTKTLRVANIQRPLRTWLRGEEFKRRYNFSFCESSHSILCARLYEGKDWAPLGKFEEYKHYKRQSPEEQKRLKGLYETYQSAKPSELFSELYGLGGVSLYHPERSKQLLAFQLETKNKLFKPSLPSYESEKGKWRQMVLCLRKLIKMQAHVWIQTIHPTYLTWFTELFRNGSWIDEEAYEFLQREQESIQHVLAALYEKSWEKEVRKELFSEGGAVYVALFQPLLEVRIRVQDTEEIDQPLSEESFVYSVAIAKQKIGHYPVTHHEVSENEKMNNRHIHSLFDATYVKRFKQGEINGRWYKKETERIEEPDVTDVLWAGKQAKDIHYTHGMKEPFFTHEPGLLTMRIPFELNGMNYGFFVQIPEEKESFNCEFYLGNPDGRDYGKNNMQDFYYGKCVFMRKEYLNDFYNGLHRFYQEKGIRYMKREEMAEKTIEHLLMLLDMPFLQDLPKLPYHLKSLLAASKKGEITSRSTFFKQVIGTNSPLLIRSLHESGDKYTFANHLKKWMKSPDVWARFFNEINQEVDWRFGPFYIKEEETLKHLQAYCFTHWKEVTVMTKLRRTYKFLKDRQKKAIPLNTLYNYLRDIERNLEVLVNIGINLPTVHEITELHDVASELHDNAVNGTTPIPFTKEEKKWEQKVEKYVFTLPKETSDLRTIGREMNICVGGYSRNALSKNCTIILCEHEKERVCIEVQKNVIVQAKQAYNRIPSEEQRTVILDWAKKGELVVRSHDLQEMQGDDFDPF